jgi:hypothetical protein
MHDRLGDDGVVTPSGVGDLADRGRQVLEEVTGMEALNGFQ